MPLELDALGGAGRRAQEVHLPLQLRPGVLAEPLERGVRLGDEAAHADGHRGALVVAAAHLGAPPAQLDDGEDVLVPLRGQADEKVQLEAAPALGERGVDRGVKVLLADELVDHLAHPPGAALGGEGEPGPPGADSPALRGRSGRGHLGCQAHGEGVDPQARQRYPHVAAGDGSDDLLDA